MFGSSAHTHHPLACRTSYIMQWVVAKPGLQVARRSEAGGKIGAVCGAGVDGAGVDNGRRMDGWWMDGTAAAEGGGKKHVEAGQRRVPVRAMP